MQNYIQGKEDECCSVRKQKIIDREAVAEVLDDDGNVIQSAQAEESHEEYREAVAEVLDDDGNVVRPAQAEKSHEELQLVKKKFNPMNGQALDDIVQSFEISDIDREIAQRDDEISRLQSEKADWEALKSDLEAL
jgi:hypothetical protein